MMTDLFAAYLARLGVSHRPGATLDALTALTARHLQTVPFENLDVMARIVHDLSTDTVLHKIALQQRGGLCWELNEAFRALLEYLGFSVYRIEGRVWQAKARRFGAPFDHLVLIVSLPGGEYLVDVGYGDGVRSPMRLPQSEASDVSGNYRLMPMQGGHSRLSRESADGSQPLYDLTLTPRSLPDFAPMYHYHQTSPESIFSTGVLCTQATATGRITVSRDRLIVVTDGLRQESHVADVAAALQHHFGIQSPTPSASADQ